MARIWNVRLNLDEFNSALAGLDSDAERLAFLSGLNAGLNGKFNMDKGAPWESGWKVGNTSHMEAIKFGEQQSAFGAKSAEARKAKYGTAQPERPSEPPSNDLRTTFERPFEGRPNQSTIDNRRIEESKNPRTTCARDEHDIGAPSDSIPPAADADRWAYLRAEPWAKALVKAGCKIGPQNWPAWQVLAVQYGHERVADVARTCPATERWPDRTETALLKSGGQTPIAQAIHHRIRMIKT